MTSLIAAWTIIHKEKMFSLIYHVNFILVIINIPALTYLLNMNILQNTDMKPMLRLFFLVFIAGFFTIAFFVCMFIVASISEGYEQ